MRNSQFMRGIGLGMAVGTAIGVACIPKRKHPMKKKAMKAMKLVAHCVEDLSSAMGM